MSNVQGKKAPVSKRARSGSFKQGKKTDMVVAYKAGNVPRNKLSLWGASARNSVYVCHGTAYPIPDVMVNKLKTSAVITIQTGASGAFASQVYTLNSCVDPFSSFGANQPRFYDQLGALYANSTVYGTKVNLKILKSTCGGAASASATRILFVPARNASVPIASCFADANELPGTMRFDIGSVVSTASYAANPNLTLTEKKEQKRYYDIGSFWGKSRQQVLTEEGFTEIVGSAAAYGVFGYLCAQELEGANQTSTQVEVTLTQYVAWSNVIAVATST